MNKKLKFIIAGVAIVAGLATAVSCQDLSKDLDALGKKVANLESTVAALQSRIDAGAVITNVTSNASGVVVTLSNGNTFTITNGKDGANGTNGKDGKDGQDGKDTVWTIGEDGFWYLNGEKTDYQAVGEDGQDGEDAAPAVYYVPNPETGNFDIMTWDEETGAYVATDSGIPFMAEDEDGITAVWEDGVLTLYGVEGAEDGKVVIGSASADDVTSIELVDVPAWFEFDEIIEQANTFGPAGQQIEFTEDKQVMTPASFIVKVTPASAQITADDIALINSKGATFDKFEILSVEPYDGVLVKATTDFALWEVVVGLSEYDAKEFKKACIVNDAVWPAVHVAYALKIGDAVTEYDLAFEHGVYANAKFNDAPASSRLSVVEGNALKDVFNIRNRAFKDDYLWAAPTLKVPTPATTVVKEGAGKNIGAKDNARGAVAPVKATAGEPIYIVFDPDQYKAAYAVVDYGQCDPADPSEENAWRGYSYEGVDQLSTTGTIAITVTGKNIDDDIVAFRVYAVNWDGTLADPDGIGFEAVFGVNAEVELDAVATTLTPKANGDYGIASALAPVSFGKIAGAVTSTLTMDDATAPAFTVTYYNDKKAAIAAGDWSNVKYISTTPQAGLDYQSYLDDVPYTGTISVSDKNGFVLATIPVSMTKVLPTAAPAGFSIKTGMLENNAYTLYVPSTNGAALNYNKIATYKYNIAKEAAVTDGSRKGTEAEYAVWANDLSKWDGEAALNFDLANFYNFGTLTVAQQAFFTTTIAGANEVIAYSDTKATVPVAYAAKGDYNSKNGTIKTYKYVPIEIAGAGNANLPTSIIDNKAHKVSVVYDYGALSYTLDEYGLPVYDDVVLEVASFEVNFLSEMGKTTFGYNWNMVANGNGTIGTVDWQTSAPNHNARVNYSAKAVLEGWQDVPTFTPSGTGATMAQDQFAIDYTPVVYLAPTININKYNEVYGDAEKNAYKKSIRAAIVADQIYIPGDHPGVAGVMDLVSGKAEDPAKNYTALSLDDTAYFTAGYAGGTNNFRLNKQAAAIEPATAVTMNMKVVAFDAYANKMQFTLPVKLVPQP